MKVKVSRIRHPLASFTGEIFVGDEKTATAEQIKLAFDYYRIAGRSGRAEFFGG